MKKISKNFLVFYVIFSIFLPIYLSYSQIELPGPQPEDITEPGLVQADVKSTLQKIFDIVFRALIWIALAFTVIFFAWAGILIIFKGDFGEGKKYLIYGTVGLIIALVSYGLVNLIGTFVRQGELSQ
jgi:FtsH-binding integral membrane protein